MSSSEQDLSAHHICHDSAQLELNRLKHIVASCTTLTPDGHECKGTAFLIDPRHVLTCAHCLGTSQSHAIIAQLRFTAWTGQQDFVAQLVDQPDWSLDIAVLELDEPISIEPLTLSSTVNTGDHWQLFGHPGGELDGAIVLTGSIRDTDANLNGMRPLLQLSCQEAADKLHGASGSPIVVNGRVVGILMHQRMQLEHAEHALQSIIKPAFQTIYALPVSTISKHARFSGRIKVNSIPTDLSRGCVGLLVPGMPVYAMDKNKSLIDHSEESQVHGQPSKIETNQPSFPERQLANSEMSIFFHQADSEMLESAGVAKLNQRKLIAHMGYELRVCYLIGQGGASIVMPLSFYLESPMLQRILLTMIPQVENGDIKFLTTFLELEGYRTHKRETYEKAVEVERYRAAYFSPREDLLRDRLLIFDKGTPAIAKRMLPSWEANVKSKAEELSWDADSIASFLARVRDSEADAFLWHSLRMIILQSRISESDASKLCIRQLYNAEYIHVYGLTGYKIPYNSSLTRNAQLSCPVHPDMNMALWKWAFDVTDMKRVIITATGSQLMRLKLDLKFYNLICGIRQDICKSTAVSYEMLRSLSEYKKQLDFGKLPSATL